MLRTFRRTRPTSCCGAQRRRTFLNLPKFSYKGLSHDSETQSYHERRILPYRRSELYKVIADVASYSNFVPYCTGSRVLESKVSQDGITIMEAELTVGFLAFRESYVSTVTCKPHESVEAVVSSSTPLFKTLTTVWCLQSLPDTSSPLSTTHPQNVSDARLALPDPRPTVVTLDLGFAFANPMHASVSATFFAQISKLMVRAFEQRCDALYGSGSH